MKPKLSFIPANDVVAVPNRLKKLYSYSAECGCGRVHSVTLTGASIRSGALDDLVPFVREFGKKLKIAVVADRITKQICADRVVQDIQSAGYAPRVIIVPDGAGNRPHADEKNLTYVEDALAESDLVISVGAGTINDLTKLASFNKGKEYLSVATAPSMNGYTSAIAAIMRRGVKRTVECHQPKKVIADLDILRNAPSHLIASGLGDLESKPTSTADYRLGGLLRNSYYCPAPEAVVLAAESRAAESAAGLKDGDTESVAALTEALVLSGLSMKLAGSSSPASGGEHLISHYWDMTGPDESRVEGWHGAQVGVATIVTSTLYEKLQAVTPTDIDIDALIRRRPALDEMETRIRKYHGYRAEEVWTELMSKHLSDDDLREELTLICDNWDALWSYLGEVLRPAARVRGILKAAGAAMTVTDLGLTPAHLINAFELAREIRGRFTVLDFASDLGLLENIRDEVLTASGCLG
jgi:glycerol-1-phosphate dehydrogenase [NAD(P)+]